MQSGFQRAAPRTCNPMLYRNRKSALPTSRHPQTYSTLCERPQDGLEAIAMHEDVDW